MFYREIGITKDGLQSENSTLYSPQERHTQVTHSMPQEKIEIFKSLEGWAETEILPFLKTVEKSWQPQDFLPEPSSDSFYDEIREIRARANELPDDYLVCLVGDMITEEALPTYQTMLNTLDGVRDETGASLTSWARWTRAWTAEENRHGDLLNKYLYLTGRVNMRAIEQTIQYLIGSGMVSAYIMSPIIICFHDFDSSRTMLTCIIVHVCVSHHMLLV